MSGFPSTGKKLLDPTPTGRAPGPPVSALGRGSHPGIGSGREAMVEHLHTGRPGPF